MYLSEWERLKSEHQREAGQQRSSRDRTFSNKRERRTIENQEELATNRNELAKEKHTRKLKISIHMQQTVS